MTIDPLGIAASPEWLAMEAKAKIFLDGCITAEKYPTASQNLWVSNAIKQCCDIGISPPRSLVRLIQLGIRTAEYRKTKQSDGAFSKETALVIKSPYRKDKQHTDSTKQYQIAVRKAAELVSEWPIGEPLPRGIPNQIQIACGADYNSIKNWIKELGFREAWLEQRQLNTGLNDANVRWNQKPRDRRARCLRAVRKAIASTHHNQS